MLLYIILKFKMLFFSAIRVLILWKPTVVHFFSEVPLSAHTSQALITGRYTLQLGLNTSDSEFKPDLPFNCIELTLR